MVARNTGLVTYFLYSESWEKFREKYFLAVELAWYMWKV